MRPIVPQPQGLRPVAAFPSLGFAVSVLVLRGPDLLPEINQRARVVMMGSVIYTPGSAHRSTLQQWERREIPEREFICHAFLGGRS